MCRRSVAPYLTHKRLFRSPTRPIPAAAPRMKAFCRKHQSHLSYKPSNWLLPTKPPLSWFLQKEAFTLPPQCCSVMPPSRVAVLVPAGDHSARQQHRPAAARWPASTSQSPCARVVFPLIESCCVQAKQLLTANSKLPTNENDTCPVRPHGHWQSSLLRKSYERPSRLSHTIKL